VLEGNTTNPFVPFIPTSLSNPAVAYTALTRFVPVSPDQFTQQRRTVEMWPGVLHEHTTYQLLVRRKHVSCVTAISALTRLSPRIAESPVDGAHQRRLAAQAVKPGHYGCPITPYIVADLLEFL
jgi:hypothetical protein